MSSAPLERLAVRQAGYSQQQGEAEERMLNNLAEIPDMAMRTRERIHRMQLADSAAQMRVEATEQKRMEVERRMYEASALYKLRSEQAFAQQAKTAADTAKLELDKNRLAWEKEIGNRRETRLAEQMPASYYKTPVRNPETGKWVFRLGGDRTRDAEPEEVAAYKAQLEAPGVQNEQRKAMGEAAKTRASRGPAGETPLRRASSATNMVQELYQALESLETNATRANPADPKLKAEILQRIESAQEESRSAFEALKKAREQEAKTPEIEANPYPGVVTDEQWREMRAGHSAEDIRATLKRLGRIK